VIEHLQLCISFWVKGRETLDEWISIIRSGEAPDFGNNLRY